MDSRRRRKQGVILALTLGGVSCCVFGTLWVIQALHTDEHTLVVRYEDTASIQEAERLGVAFLEMEDLIVIPLGNSTYRIGVFVDNPNSDWIARSFEYDVVADTDPQQHIEKGVSSVGVSQRVLLVADVSTRNVPLHTITFVIRRINWQPAEDVRAKVRVRNPQVTYRTKEDVFVAEVSGIVVNDSSIFIQKGSVSVIGVSENEDIVFIGEIQFYSLRPSGEQPFTLQYKTAKSAEIKDVRFTISFIE